MILISLLENGPDADFASAWSCIFKFNHLADGMVRSHSDLMDLSEFKQKICPFAMQTVYTCRFWHKFADVHLNVPRWKIEGMSLELSPTALQA